MKAVIQRVSDARVEINQEIVGQINHGYLILLGIHEEDDSEDVDWLVRKISQVRLFSDSEGKMNLDIQEVNGEVLVVSQFTLHAKYKKGNRPSYIKAAHPDHAIPLYEDFKMKLGQTLGKSVESGEFGAMMQVSLTNDGPVTLIIDTKNKE